MSRRAPIVIVALVAILLAMATAAQPVQLWVAPTLGNTSPSADDSTAATVAAPSEDDSPESSVAGPTQGVASLLKALAVVLGLVGVGLVIALRGLWPHEWPSWKRHSRSVRPFSSLPDLHEDAADIDVSAARATLSVGHPRSAIVACWIQLELDIAAVGFPRADAETSAEYVRRVVAKASVDPRPISELAELYREARFSDHELRDGDRVRAFEALSRVEAGLRSNAGVSA